MKEKLNKSLAEIQAHPDVYRRMWSVELMGEVIEGMYEILCTGLYLYYKNGELFLTDQEEG